MNPSIEPILKTKEQLNQVSPSFCLAKWLMLTLHLEQGETHSCYHPWTHKIPLGELKRDPSALHNTDYKKEQRRLMLKGERPSECQYCWNVEDMGHISDRMIRSSEQWAGGDFARIAGLDYRANVNPRHAEISFDSVCNLKCIYCNPTVSSKWREEITQHGGYPTSTRFNDFKTAKITSKDESPYIQAFWKWWPDLSKDLRIFRLTGGEPLLSAETFRILDWFAENPNPELEIAINSNLSVPEKLIDKLIQKTHTLLEGKKIRKVSFFPSIDTSGEQAEYIRTGLNYTYFMKNVERLLTEIPRSQVCFTVTFNALSVPRFSGLLEEILRLRRTYQASGPRRLLFDTPYLRFPPHLSIQILPTEFREALVRCKQFMVEHSDLQSGFHPLEIEKMQRLHDWMSAEVNAKDLEIYRRDFFLYFSEHDRRRGTDFLKVFPELEAFYNQCRQLVEGRP